MADFRRYQVWRKAHRLTLQTYDLTTSFPTDERFGLTVQMRRAVASIPMNIADGFGKEGDKERARFVNIAMGSASEFQYQLLLCRDLLFLTDTKWRELEAETVEVRKMLSALHARLKRTRDPLRANG